MRTELPPLKCGGCRKCCLGDTITLHPGDDPTRYKTKVVDGKRVLAKGKDGNCIYLGVSGCRIYGRQPMECRVFDCRKYALLFSGWSREKQAQRLATSAALHEGLRRLEAMADTPTNGASAD